MSGGPPFTLRHHAVLRSQPGRRRIVHLSTSDRQDWTTAFEHLARDREIPPLERVSIIATPLLAHDWKRELLDYAPWIVPAITGLRLAGVLRFDQPLEAIGIRDPDRCGSYGLEVIVTGLPAPAPLFDFDALEVT